jgi:hypothetical protein
MFQWVYDLTNNSELSWLNAAACIGVACPASGIYMLWMLVDDVLRQCMLVRESYARLRVECDSARHLGWVPQAGLPLKIL